VFLTVSISQYLLLRVKPTILYVTENSQGNKLLRTTIPLEDKDEEKKKKDKDSYKIK